MIVGCNFENMILFQKKIWLPKNIQNFQVIKYLKKTSIQQQHNSTTTAGNECCNNNSRTFFSFWIFFGQTSLGLEVKSLFSKLQFRKKERERTPQTTKDIKIIPWTTKLLLLLLLHGCSQAWVTANNNNNIRASEVSYLRNN